MNPVIFHYEVISGFPSIGSLRYLELGAFDGKHFESIKAKTKETVDCDDSRYANVTHKITTDEFFKTISGDRVWDLIFIDADHDCMAVFNDFNNSIKHLASGGSIFLHDMWPPSEKHVQPNLCGTGYRILSALIRADRYSLYTMEQDYGLTLLHRPTEPLLIDELDSDLSYRDFLDMHRNSHKRYQIGEMKNKIKEICG